MPEGKRPERVSEEFREILAEEIPKLKDPRVGFVTVTAVSVTPDLRRATIYYTVMGDEVERRSTRAGLASARAHLRATVGRQVRMKFLPELEFREDEGIERADRLERLLREIHSREQEPGAPEDRGDDDGAGV
ncbi:MAG TPA: 30S ribosome-binding factor RbfA [Actinomycetota bacterium]|nr:30S ribosome-binding factor RbfA [Actinomycetota bacterium]